MTSFAPGDESYTPRGAEGSYRTSVAADPLPPGATEQDRMH